jgi:fibronectin type 3 domain-containing protein
VYRGTTSGGPYTQLGLTQSGTTQYTDKTVQNSQTYYYVVTAFDANYVQSAFSSETSATIPAT